LSPDLRPDDRRTYPLADVLGLPDGTLAEWEATGSGEPLLWIEGGPGLPAHLARPDVGLLADRFRPYLVNAPGCGRTTAPATADGYDLDAHVRFFDAFRRARGLGPVTVMGHSWGGLVALALALAAPSSVLRLIIIDGYAGEASVPEDVATVERERALDRVRDQGWFDTAVATFAEDLDMSAAELDERFERCWPLYFANPDGELARRHIARLGRETRWNIEAARAWSPEPPLDLLPQLAQIQCPTLVIAGEHDFICGPAWNRPIADGIPRGEYFEVPGAGHFPQYEAPQEFRRTVLDWLARSG
jgi:proline iminopeptidase